VPQSSPDGERRLAFEADAVKSQESPLRSITLLRDAAHKWTSYPFSVPVVRNLERISISESVCFFAGENGSGKSTLLEGIALAFGFGMQGGSKHMRHITDRDEEMSELAKALQLSWRRKPLQGYFLRIETLHNVASYIDQLAAEDPGIYGSYGGKSLHAQSHGESLLALLQHRFSRDGFYVLDEPETALSPQRQLGFLVILHQLVSSNQGAQFLIATHSPIILAYPKAQIFVFDRGAVEEVRYEETEAYKVASGFLSNPEAYLKHLLM
jgi:predicted ATPase